MDYDREDYTDEQKADIPRASKAVMEGLSKAKDGDLSPEVALESLMICAASIMGKAPDDRYDRVMSNCVQVFVESSNDLRAYIKKKAATDEH